MEAKQVTNQNDIICRLEVEKNIGALADALKADPAKFDQMDDLRDLRDLIEAADNDTNYKGGNEWVLIRDSYFIEYAKNEAVEINGGDVDSWPFTCIDWERAARELQTDYKQVDYDGVTYWVRA